MMNLCLTNTVEDIRRLVSMFSGWVGVYEGVI